MDSFHEERQKHPEEYENPVRISWVTDLCAAQSDAYSPGIDMQYPHHWQSQLRRPSAVDDEHSIIWRNIAMQVPGVYNPIHRPMDFVAMAL